MSNNQAGPDPAFLNNVPGAIASTSRSIQSTSTRTSSFSSSSSTTSASSTSTTSTSTTSSAASSTTSSGSSTDTVSVYFYRPSTALATVFPVLYFALIPYHFYLSIFLPHVQRSVHQKHNYTIPLFVATVFSTLGYSARIASVASESGRSSVLLYALSQIFIIVAPIFICATLYLLISHLIRLCLPEGKQRVFLGISPQWLGRIFITSDVLSFLCQGAGSGIAASNNWTGETKTLGTNVLIFGLAAQLATFTLYVIVLALFCQRISAGSGGGSDHEKRREYGFNPLHKQVVKGIWIASVLIEIRSVYRTIEFGTGTGGYLFRHEWPLWVFEATPVWLALLVLGIYHPVKWLQQKRRSAFLDKDNRRVGTTQGIDDRLPK